MKKSTIIKLSTFAFLVAATASVVGFYPRLSAVYAKTVAIDPIKQQTQHRLQRKNTRPAVEVVFVLDTTGSMGGLIQTAKEKIWSIATTMASAQPAPEIKIGLVAYRDRGDAYVTRVTDLSKDLDSVYATLMDYRAEGGGDGPESVNQALFDAVNKISWSNRNDVYKAIFLVGDAPPHMDYLGEVQYPQTLKVAKTNDIVINTIQCGEAPDTMRQWQQIAQMSRGEFFNVAQSGSGVKIATPFDEQIASLSKQLEDTKLYFGDEQDREKQARKIAAIEKLFAGASAPSIASRATFNASASGSENFAGDKELVEEITSNELRLSSVPETHLPEPVRTLAPEKREAFVQKKAKERADLNQRIRELGQQRQQFIERKVVESGEGENSLDDQIYSVIKDQGAKAGLKYEADSAAY